jgi:hypothetical protein
MPPHPRGSPRTAGYAALDSTDVDGVDAGGLENKRIPGGEHTISGWLSRITFWWANPAITYGYKEIVEDDQMWELAEQDTLEDCTGRLHAAFVVEQGAATGSTAAGAGTDAAKTAEGEGPAMWNMPLGRAFWTVHCRKYFVWILVKIISDFVAIVPTILLNSILTFLDDDDAPDSKGYVLVGVSFLLMALSSIATNLFFYHTARIAMQFKVAIIGIVYRKILRLTPGAAPSSNALCQAAMPPHTCSIVD